MLKQLINNEKTDKNTLHSYLETYETLFNSKKYTTINLLEIGIAGGGSIKLWHDYFLNATICGLDIIQIKYHWNEIKNNNRINLGCFNAYDKDFFDGQLLSKDTKFDIIIDDGPHTLESMIFFVQNYSKILNEDGILIVEDVADIGWVDILSNCVEENMKKYIEVYDLRKNKNRFDDILFVINLNKNIN